MPIGAKYFIGTVDGELVCHLAVATKFEAKGYRATRLVVMPEWQGAGVGTKFLNYVCAYHKSGLGACGKKYGTFFHTSHPQLVQFLRRSKGWVQKSANLFGANKRKCARSIGTSSGYGGHFRAVQGFKYIGEGLK
jgi:GNAT superfamily N-acetyltransferase